MWVLQRSDPESEPLVLRVATGSMKTIGRSEQADLVLDAALVSRLHCRLEARSQSMDVVDLESTNGTYINDARVERGTLADGDRLKIGRVEFKVLRTDG